MVKLSRTSLSFLILDVLTGAAFRGAFGLPPFDAGARPKAPFGFGALVAEIFLKAGLAGPALTLSEARLPDTGPASTSLRLFVVVGTRVTDDAFFFAVAIVYFS